MLYIIYSYEITLNPKDIYIIKLEYYNYFTQICVIYKY